jgi:plastocyanin
LGGFPAGDVYVSVRQNIYQITPDGKTVTLFATIPNLPNSNNFLTFDQVGSFGFKLIVVGGQRATVYTVDSTATWALITDCSSQTQELEGSEVAPTNFVPFGGDLISASKFDNTVYAIQPSGGPCLVVGGWDSPEQALFVPSAVCNWSTSGGAFFVNVEGSSKVVKFPASSLAGLAGTPTALVTSEAATDIGQFTSNGTSIDISTFYGPPSPPLGLPDLEEAVFAGGCAGHAASSPSTGSILPSEIYKMTSAGANQTRLTTNTTDDSRPAWSPDGTSIVFQSDRDDPNQPGCEATGTCLYEIYTMSATDGSGQVNVSNSLTSNDTSPDWETVSFTPITVDDFFYSPQIAKPKQGGTVLWEFYSTHTASDNSGMGLFDSGTKVAGQFFYFNFTAAGQYPYHCTIHPTLMSGTVKVPMKVAPTSGTQSTTFTLTWATTVPPSGYKYDVQISRPGGTGFVDWITNTGLKTSTFVADGGTGVYSFQARIRNTSNGFASNYSAPISITVNP